MTLLPNSKSTFFRTAIIKGLSEKLLKRMDKKVNTLVEDWQECFKIRSWNNSFYAQVYIEGLLTLDRN